MTDRAREDTIERIERVLDLTHKNSLTITIPRLTAERAVSMLKEQEETESMEVTYLYTELQDKLVQMMAEYLCEDHTEKELMELVDKAMKYSNGEKD